MKWASLLCGDFHKIPIEWRADFQKEWILTCYSRSRVIAWITLFYPLMVIPALISNLLNSEPIYLGIVFLTLIPLFIVSLITLLNYKDSQNLDLSDRIYRQKSKLIWVYSLTLMIFLNITFVMIWIKTGISSPYVVGILTYAFLFYQPNKLGLTIYLANFIIYLVCVTTFRFPFHYQSVAYFSGFFSTIGGWIIASMLFSSRVQEFISTRTIKLQSQELQKVNEELHKLVNTDGLTQVANRRKFDQHLDFKHQELSDKSTLGILLCDIDYFKLFNDRYGHQAGDECLQKVAATIQSDIREDGDLVARYGGEEFVIILCNTSEPEALQVAQRICHQVQNLHIPHERSPIKEVTLSIGVFCAVPSAEYSPEQMISRADQALYLAKSKGRNQAIYANNSYL